MAFIAPLIVAAAANPFTAAALGAGAFFGGKSLLKTAGKAFTSGQAAPAPATKPPPEAPKIEDAAKQAKADVARRRRISVLSGGVTNITKGQALVSEGNLARKSLLGT